MRLLVFSAHYPTPKLPLSSPGKLPCMLIVLLQIGLQRKRWQEHVLSLKMNPITGFPRQVTGRGGGKGKAGEGERGDAGGR